MPCAHSRGSNVQEGQHSRLRVPYDAIAKIIEVVCARRPGIHHGGHTAPKREGIRLNGFAARLAPHVYMNVKVDQAGRDVQPSYIDGLYGIRYRNGLIDTNNLPACYRDIHHAIRVVLRIDHMTALEQEVMLWTRLGSNTSSEQKNGQEIAHFGLGRGRMALRPPRVRRRVCLQAGCYGYPSRW